MAVSIANYHEVIEALHDPEVLIIDVRDPEEIEENGSIPKSINIPLHKVQAELRLSRLGFVAKYQRNKPSFSHKIIFYCKFGEMGQQAAEIAAELGYKNVRNYKSGFSEWMYKWHEYQDFVDEQRFKQQQDLRERLGE